MIVPDKKRLLKLLDQTMILPGQEIVEVPIPLGNGEPPILLKFKILSRKAEEDAFLEAAVVWYQEFVPPVGSDKFNRHPWADFLPVTPEEAIIAYTLWQTSLEPNKLELLDALKFLRSREVLRYILDSIEQGSKSYRLMVFAQGVAQGKKKPTTTRTTKSSSRRRGKSTGATTMN